MGATNFSTVAAGSTVAKAMGAAIKEALYWHGHGGYSGTIAEKSHFVEFTLPARITSERFEDVAWKAMDERWANEGRLHRAEKPKRTPNLDQLVKWLGKANADRCLETMDDKWGPCVAVRLGATEGKPHIPKTPTGKCKAGYAAYRFFGLASC